MTFREWVQSEREAGSTQAQLARRIGTSQATLSRVLNGQRKLSYVLANRIAAVSGIPWDRLPVGIRAK